MQKVPKRQLRKAQSKCFHYGHGFNLKKEDKTEKEDKEKKEKKSNSNLTEENNEFMEKTFSYYKKKGVVKFWNKDRKQKIDLDLL